MMNERKMLPVIIVLQALHCATAMFFHAPSSIIMHGSGAENKSDFGFAMTFMKGREILVVGAPKVDNIGGVYSCDIDNDIKDTCLEHSIASSTDDFTNDEFPNQHFYMGSTVVATSEYFFTCAPLWTTKINATDSIQGRIEIEDAYGTCFVYYPKTDVEFRFHGLLEHYKGLKRDAEYTLKTDRFTGGTGWTTLLDEENKLLLIAKTSLQGDFMYLNSTHPDRKVDALLDEKKPKKFTAYLNNFINIGFGVAGGKFFSKETVYAFSMLQKNMQGVIGFLKRKTRTSSKLVLLSKGIFSQRTAVQVENYDVATMFGTTMSAADLNTDGLDELLVAAPAQSEDECVECGALHIYIGGDMNTINEQKRLRTIFASAHFGRFGTAIATNDIDGDGKPDLVVSAPFENQGRGAIYILSGYELYHTLMKTQDYKSIQLSDMKMTQRIHKEPQRMLGFSLQFLPDTDENGCGELAVGSPGTSQVLVFKCVQKINVTLSSRLVGEQIVREQDTFFTVQVCARVQLPEKPWDIVGDITIDTSIVEEAAVVKQPKIVIDITCLSCPRDRQDLCENVIVALKDKEPRYYTLHSKAKLQNNYLLDKNMKVFNGSWVEASPYSKLETSLIVSRHCSGDDCDPNLSMELLWSGSESYVPGSSANETATIRVRNDGNASYSACVWLRVVGAPVTQAGCRPDNKGFRCDLSSPLKRDAEESITLLLDMTKIKNVEENLIVEVKLYENCNQENVIKSNKTLTVHFNLTSDNVSNNGDFHKLNITDKQILENAIIFDHHEYVIRNNGSITWEHIQLDVELETRPYIESFDILDTDLLKCDENYQTTPTAFIHHCNLTLPPNTTQVVVATIGIMARGLKGLTNGPELNVTSMSKLFLTRAPTLYNTSITEITIRKELTLSSNKLMIGLIAAFLALILLAILTFILYKCGFFKRKQQQQLLVAKESIRRKSVRRNTHVSAMDGPVEGLQMDVDDDSPFEEARPVTTFDDVGLVDKDEN